LKYQLVFYFFFSFWAGTLYGQNYSYVNYDVKDGLAGSAVYCMVQDKDGFLWMGTETGLSRFDGTRFKNFSTSDGLPDNEVVKLFVDSKNRVWIVPFRNSLCYYLNGKIHNVDNDSLLKNIKQSSELMSITENGVGDLLILETGAIHIIDGSGKTHQIYEVAGQPILTYKAGLNSNKEFRIGTAFKNQYNEVIADIKDTQLIVIKSVPQARNHEYGNTFFNPSLEVFMKDNVVTFTSKNDEFKLPLSPGFINASEIDDTTFAFNYSNKTYLFDARQKKVTDSFSVGKTINNVIRDSEGSLWFCTMGKGVYRLASNEFENFSFKTNNGYSPIFCIQKIDSTLYLGGENSFIWALNSNLSVARSIHISNSHTRGRIITMTQTPNKGLLIGTDEGLFISNHWNTKIFMGGLSIKDVFLGNDGRITTSTSKYTLRFNLSDGPFKFGDCCAGKYLDTIWSDRSTCVYGLNDTNYVGTLNGLYAVGENKGFKFAGAYYESLKKRIAIIKGVGDGTICIGTSGNGLVLYRDGKIIRELTTKDGLTSNICRNLFISGRDIWAGTDKGLNKIHRSDTGYAITTFTTSDGLKSNIINAVYVDGENVLVGTPEGLTRFDVNKKAKGSNCKLFITDIIVSGQEIPYTPGDLMLPHQDNNIRIDFAGISFKSAGEILYKYKFAQDSDWSTTNQNSLIYPSLASGNYEIELSAINKFGVESNHVIIRFTIKKLLREELWFQLLVFLFSISLISFFVYLRVKSFKRKVTQRTLLAEKIAVLEQMALRSQMNPHFIFNSLNSIQQYVIDKDILGANEFITEFSRLIRLTLDLSSKPEVSIEQEVVYLSTYLELEKKRFENKFTYTIHVEPEISAADHFIPTMILQPYVENSVRHGMRYKKDNEGKITISFYKDSDYLVCNIEDNGIGRKQALQFKSIAPMEYQSKGMSLTARRIEVFNTTHEASIEITIEDIEGSFHKPAGTKVIIKFPLKETHRPNDTI